MKLYLMRHAEAVAADVDSTRPLTEFGFDQAGQAAQYLVSKSLGLIQICHSPKRRTAQTAEVIAAALGCELLCDPRLGPDLPLSDLQPWLCSLPPDAADQLWVGHMPYLAELWDQLTLASAPRFLRLAQIVALERDESRRLFQTLWSFTPTQPDL